MKLKLLTGIALLSLSISIAVISCKKESSSSTQSTNEQATANLSASAINSKIAFDDVFDLVTQTGEAGNMNVNAVQYPGKVLAAHTLASTTFTTIAGAKITVTPLDPAVYPKTVVIDFGTGVTSADGVTRKGKITITLSGKLRIAGSTISVTFNNYSVNGFVLAGTYSLTPKLASGGGIDFSISVSNASITTPAGESATYSGTGTFTQTAGIGTPTFADDTYAITGNFTYADSKGNSITGNITKALVKPADCKNITSGTIAFVYKGTNALLDFGAGTCDNQATVTVGSTVKTITLPK